MAKNNKPTQPSQDDDLVDMDVLSINMDKLDWEWRRQSRLYFTYAEKLANARKDHEVAKNTLQVTFAEWDRKIRRDPESHGLEKPTETSIKSVILVSKDHQKAEKELIEAKHRVDIIQAFVDALDHKKKALENMVHLHGQNYFSEPHISKGGSRDDVDGAATDYKKKKKTHDR